MNLQSLHLAALVYVITPIVLFYLFKVLGLYWGWRNYKPTTITQADAGTIAEMLFQVGSFSK